MKTTPLKRLARLIAGATPPVADEHYWADIGTPWVTIADMTAQPRVGTTARQLSSLGVAHQGMAKGRAGTLLFAMYASVGTLAVLDTEASWNQAIVGVVPAPTTDSRFLRYVLESLRPQLQRWYRSNTQDNLNAEQVGQLPIPDQPPEEQRKIANYLDRETARIDALIAAKRQTVKLIWDRHQAVLAEALNVTSVIRSLTIRRLCLPSGMFCDGDWIEAPFISDTGIRLIQTGNIGVGMYREQGFRYVSDETYTALKCTEVKPGDVLICRMADPVGRSCIAPDLGCRMITSVDVAILRPNATIADSAFLNHYFSSPQYLGMVEAIARGGTRQRISRDQLGAISVGLPALAEQKRLADAFDRSASVADEVAKKLEGSIRLLIERRAALITGAVAGQSEISGVAV